MKILSQKTIDDTDRKILALLSANSRMSYREIAKKIEVSESTVRNRVDNLVKQRIIKSFTISIDPAVLHKNVSAFITIKPRNDAKEKVVESMLNSEEITEIYVLNIQCGYIVKVEVESLEKLNSYVEKLRENEAIDTFEPCIVLRTPKKQAIQFGCEKLKDLGIEK